MKIKIKDLKKVLIQVRHSYMILPDEQTNTGVFRGVGEFEDSICDFSDNQEIDLSEFLLLILKDISEEVNKRIVLTK